jgi:outer membrane protein TolC
MELGLPNQGRFRSVKPLDGDELAAVEARLAQEQADADLEAAKLQLIQDYLPSWSQVETIVDNISTLAEAKAFLKKLARINYLFIKERTE